MNKKALTQKIKDKALSLGFMKVGITTADDFNEYAEELLKRTPSYDFLKQLPNTFNGAYPRSLMLEAKSIVCVVYDYSNTSYPKKLSESVARAYQCRGYNPTVDSINGARISLFKDFLIDNGCTVGEDIHVPDRLACARAGIVNFGSNNFAYAEGIGSFIILKCFVIDIELEYDRPTMERKCPPNCRICIDSCPTKAIAEPGKLLPQRCLAFNHWATKHVPIDIRELNGKRIHGCDVCQEVCPRNKEALNNANKHDPYLEFLSEEFDLEKVLLMNEEGYYERIIHPIMYNYIRSKKVFQRNAAIALGNTKDNRYIPSLAKALNSCDSLVREYAAWALGNIGGGLAVSALKQSLSNQEEENVKEAIIVALEKLKD